MKDDAADNQRARRLMSRKICFIHTSSYMCVRIFNTFFFKQNIPGVDVSSPSKPPFHESMSMSARMSPTGFRPRWF